MSVFVDTHVHLNDELLFNDLDKNIADAKEVGVEIMFVVGWDLASSKKALDIANSYDNIYAIVGIHPCNARGVSEADYKELEDLAKNSKVVAIGEIGFDFHWDDTTLEEQEEAFLRCIEIAKKVKKPISIHAREADQKTYSFLKEHYNSPLGGVMHAYSGSAELAKEYIKMNFIFGIGGVVTFKNAKTLKRVVEEIDLSYLISETDSPYLTPTPHRGEVNYPKYIPLIVEEIARIKGIMQEEVISQINENVKRIFNI